MVRITADAREDVGRALTICQPDFWTVAKSEHKDAGSVGRAQGP